MKLNPTIIIDSREQRPFRFKSLPAVRGTLDTGDYSIAGLEHLIAVERKSLDDLLACVGRERDRSKRELQRLRAYRFRLVVVETDAATIEKGQWRSNLQPAHVLGSLGAWTAQYALPIWLAGTHEAAGHFVERFLFQCARCIASEHEAATAFVQQGDAEGIRSELVTAAA